MVSPVSLVWEMKGGKYFEEIKMTEERKLVTNLVGRSAWYESPTETFEEFSCEIVGVYWEPNDSKSGESGWAALVKREDGKVHDVWLRHLKVTS